MLAYCDYIASQIFTELTMDSMQPYTKIGHVDFVKYDLHPIDGYLMSTKKTIEITDVHGKQYKVTVEELNK